MSDPYNTATVQPRATEPADATAAPPAARPVPRTPRRAAKHNAQSERTALLPVVNVVAVLAILVWTGVRRGGMSPGSFFLVCGPMLLAIAVAIWSSNRTFTTIVRVLNAFLSGMVLVRLMRYASHGMFNANLLVLFVLSVAVPAFNAFCLKPKSVD